MRRFSISLSGWACLFLAAVMLASCGGDGADDLDADSQTALEVGIISTLMSPSAFNSVTLSESLRKKHEKIEGLQLRNAAYGAFMPAPEGGALISAPDGLVLETEVSGSIVASVKVRDGEVGLVNGQIYISEGTKLTNKDGHRFIFKRGKWRKGGSKQSAGAGPEVDMVISFSREKVSQSGLSNEGTLNPIIAASVLYETYWRSTRSESDLTAMIEAVHKLEVAKIDDQVVYLADIAKIEIHESSNTSGNVASHVSIGWHD